MNVVLLRVGIDLSEESGGIYGPLFSDGTFEFIPIRDNWGVDRRTYGSIRGRHGKKLIDYFPQARRQAMKNIPCHVDPEFETFTYGDPTQPKRGLRCLGKGDLLVFYCGLEGWGDDKSERALYIVGYFEVEAADLANTFSPAELRRFFAKNFHYKHRKLFTAQRDHLILVKGSAKSKQLNKAVRVSENGLNRNGSRIYVLSRKMRKIFGDFEGVGSIERSNPRWVDATHVARAARFVRSLEREATSGQRRKSAREQSATPSALASPDTAPMSQAPVDSGLPPEFNSLATP